MPQTLHMLQRPQGPQMLQRPQVSAAFAAYGAFLPPPPGKRGFLDMYARSFKILLQFDSKV